LLFEGIISIVRKNAAEHDGLSSDAARLG